MQSFCVLRPASDDVVRRARLSPGPPVIEPFTFPRFMEEGSRAKILCSVIKGDPPIAIRWLKDSRLLTSSALNAISISTLDEFSSAIVISKVSLAHRGNYTCIASNAASSSNYTAEAVVYGELRAERRCLSPSAAGAAGEPGRQAGRLQPVAATAAAADRPAKRTEDCEAQPGTQAQARQWK